MRIKYYLRGIGFGIIFAVIVMSVAFSKKNNQQISDAEIIQRAKQLGMVDAASVGDVKDTEQETEQVVPEGQMNSEKLQETEVLEENSKDKSEKIGKDKGSVNSLANSSIHEEEKKDGDKQGESTLSDNGASVTDNKSDVPANEEEKYITVTIKRGQVCRQIAEDLEKKGIVDDADAFREYMGSRGLASSIRCGTFNLPKGASYQKIADCLIKE